jgi:hypothetical protein
MLNGLTPDPTDAPSLLSRAGLTTTTVDVEDFTIAYPTMWELIADLRDMGESNAILGRRPWISRDVLMAAEGIYKGASVTLSSLMAEMYGKDGHIPATFQIIYMVGIDLDCALTTDRLATWTNRAQGHAPRFRADQSQGRFVVEGIACTYNITITPWPPP